MSLIRMIKLGAKVAEWAAPRVQEWQRAKSFNEDEGWRNLEAGNPGEAERLFLLVFEESRPSPAKRLQLTLGIAEAQRRQGKLAEASETARKALAMATEAKNHESRQEALQVLMDLHLDQGHAAQALELAQEIIHKENARPRPQEELLVKHHRKFGAVLLQNGFHEKSVEAYRLSVKLAELTFGLDHVEMADSLTGLGSVLRQTGKYAEAQDCLRAALEVHRAVRGPESREVTEDLNQLAASLEEAGDIQGAIGEYEKALSLSERQIGGNPEDTIMVRVHLAALYLQTNRVSAARELLLHAIRVLEKRADDRYVLALKVLAFAEEYSNHPEEAQRLRHKAVAVVDKREGRAVTGALDEPKADAAPMVVLPSVPKPSAPQSAPQPPVSIIVVAPGMPTAGEAGAEQRVAYTTHTQLTPYTQPVAHDQSAAQAETPQIQPGSDFTNFYQRPAQSLTAAAVPPIAASPIAAHAEPTATPVPPAQGKQDEEPPAPLSIWKADAPPPVAPAPVAPPSQLIQVPAGMQVVLMSGDQLAGAQDAVRRGPAAQPNSDFADFYKTPPAASSVPHRPSPRRSAETPSEEIRIAPSVHAEETEKAPATAQIPTIAKNQIAEDPAAAQGEHTSIQQQNNPIEQQNNPIEQQNNPIEPPVDPRAASAQTGGTETTAAETGIVEEHQVETIPLNTLSEPVSVDRALAAPPERVGVDSPLPISEQPALRPAQQIAPQSERDLEAEPASAQQPAVVRSEDIFAPAPLASSVSLRVPGAAEPPLFALVDSQQPQSLVDGVTTASAPAHAADGPSLEALSLDKLSLDTPSPGLRRMLPLRKPTQAPPLKIDAEAGVASLSVAPNFVDGQVRLPSGDPSFLPKESDAEVASPQKELQPRVSLNPGPAAECDLTKKIHGANISTTSGHSPAVFEATPLVLPARAGSSLSGASATAISPPAFDDSSPFPLQMATPWQVDLSAPSAPTDSAALVNSPAPFTPEGRVYLPEKGAALAQPVILALQLAPAVSSAMFAARVPPAAVPEGAVLATERSFSAQATGFSHRTVSYPRGAGTYRGVPGADQNECKLPEGELQLLGFDEQPKSARSSTRGALLSANDPKPLTFRHRDTRVRYPRPNTQQLSDDDHHDKPAQHQSEEFAAIPAEKMLGANGLLHLAMLTPSPDETAIPAANQRPHETGKNGTSAPSPASPAYASEEQGDELPQLTLGGDVSGDDLSDPFGF